MALKRDGLALFAGFIAAAVAISIARYTHKPPPKPKEFDFSVLPRNIFIDSHKAASLALTEVRQNILNTPDGVTLSGDQYVWDLFPPQFNCISKEWVGAFSDEGRFMCGVRTFLKKPSCVIYLSMPQSHKLAFEASIADKTRCNIYLLDPNLPQSLHNTSKYNNQLKFQRIGLGLSDSDEYKTLQTVMAELGHTWLSALVLDFQGQEWQVVPQLLKQFDSLPTTQLSLRMHILQKPAGDGVPGLVESMQKQGLHVFDAQPLLMRYEAQQGQHAMEYQFVRLSKDGRILTAPDTTAEF